MISLIAVYEVANSLKGKTFQNVIDGLTGVNKSDLQRMYEKYIKPASYVYLINDTVIDLARDRKYLEWLIVRSQFMMTHLDPEKIVLPLTGLYALTATLALGSPTTTNTYVPAGLPSWLNMAPVAANVTSLSLLLNGQGPNFADNGVGTDINVPARLLYMATTAAPASMNAGTSVMDTEITAPNGVTCTLKIKFTAVSRSVSDMTGASMRYILNNGAAIVLPMTRTNSTLVGGMFVNTWEVKADLPNFVGQNNIRWTVDNVATAAAGDMLIQASLALESHCIASIAVGGVIPYTNRAGGADQITKDTVWSNVFGQISNMDPLSTAVFDNAIGRWLDSWPYLLNGMIKWNPGIINKYTGKLGSAGAIGNIQAWFFSGVVNTQYKAFHDELLNDIRSFEAAVQASYSLQQFLP
jgi:hypothetical protein